MKNKDFFYLQYNKINWENQVKTRINEYIHKYVINKILFKRKNEDISVFDIGFGLGIFPKMLCQKLGEYYRHVTIEGCEPSRKNYDYFLKHPWPPNNNVRFKASKNTFLSVQTKTKFDFVTAIYVFPHFLSSEIDKAARKIYSMLKDGGKFILVVANEKYLEKKLSSQKDLFIEKKNIFFNGKGYKEILHYSDIPKIGKIIDYNREESFYLNVFKKQGLVIKQKRNINDNGFICTIFTFEKK